MFQNFLVNNFKEGFSLFVLIISLFLSACSSDGESVPQNVSSSNDQNQHLAILGPIRNGDVQVIDVDNNSTLYTTITDDFGLFQVDINDTVNDETWLELIVSSGVDIDSDDDGNISEPFIPLQGQLLLLCKAKDLRENSVNVNVFTTIAATYYGKSTQNIETFLNDFSKTVFRESLDQYTDIDYRDLFAYKPNHTSNTSLQRIDLYQRMLDEKIMESILQNRDLYSFLREDTDGDTLDLWTELLNGSSAQLVDTDGDGINDDVEVQEGLNPTLKDSDFDGIDDSNESLYGTSALDSDTDGDYLPDGIEIGNNTDPLNADENSNNILDGLEGDPFFQYQWYLQSLGTVVANTVNIATIIGNDLGILDVYHKVLGNNNGYNSIVQVVDTGVEALHEDLNVDLNNSFNAITHTNDPTPTWDVSKSDPVSPLEIGHGTAVAGIIGAKTNNEVGIRGIVPRCDIAGSNWLEDQTLSELDRVWYSQINDTHIGVSNNSWGAYYIKDDGFERILALGTEQLRDGKGRVYVFAAGNFRQDFGNSNLSYLTNNPYSISVAALNSQEKYASYSSPGSNILVSAYGGEHYYTAPTIMTTSLSGESYYESELNGATGTITVDEDTQRSYTYAMNGTSSAAPMVSGSIALVLDACPSLTWRDVRWLVAKNAIKVDASNSSWIINGAGLEYSTDYGYGKINPNGMIEMCQSSYFQPLNQMQQTYVDVDNLSIVIPDNNTTIVKTIDFTDQLSIEWLGLTVNTDHPYSGDLEINLISPMGTKISIMTPNDVRFAGYENGFRFGSVGFMDEDSKGIWRVEITDRLSGDEGSLKGIRLEVFGHEN